MCHLTLNVYQLPISISIISTNSKVWIVATFTFNSIGCQIPAPSTTIEVHNLPKLDWESNVARIIETSDYDIPHT